MSNRYLRPLAYTWLSRQVGAYSTTRFPAGSPSRALTRAAVSGRRPRHSRSLRG